MKEEWRPVQDYEESYEVSNLGRVKSLDRYIMKGKYPIHRKGKILKLIEDGHGYMYVCLANDGIQHQRLVHVLVATAFIPKPNSKLEVNHIDGNKKNNAVSNLEWVTHKYNIQHSFETGLHPKLSKDRLLEWARKGAKVSADKHSIPVLCETDGLAFISQNAADRFYGFHVGTISGVLRKRNHTFKGRAFRRLLDVEKSNYTLLS